MWFDDVAGVSGSPQSGAKIAAPNKAPRKPDATATSGTNQTGASTSSSAPSEEERAERANMEADRQGATQAGDNNRLLLHGPEDDQGSVDEGHSDSSQADPSTDYSDVPFATPETGETHDDGDASDEQDGAEGYDDDEGQSDSGEEDPYSSEEDATDGIYDDPEDDDAYVYDDVYADYDADAADQGDVYKDVYGADAAEDSEHNGEDGTPSAEAPVVADDGTVLDPVTGQPIAEPITGEQPDSGSITEPLPDQPDEPLPEPLPDQPGEPAPDPQPEPQPDPIVDPDPITDAPPEVTPEPATDAPVTDAPPEVTPEPVTDAPVTPAPPEVTPEPVTDAPVTPAPPEPTVAPVPDPNVPVAPIPDPNAPLVPDPNLPPVDPNAPVAGALPVIGTPREIADQARITELNAWFDSVSSPQDASREDRIKASVELATLTAPEGASEEAIKFAAALFLRESGFANDDYRNWSSNFREGNNGFNMKEVGTEGTRNIADRETVNGQDVMLRSDFGTYHTVADNFQSFWGWMAEKPNYSGFTDIQDPMQGLEVMAQSGWATDMGQLEKIRYAQRTGDHSVFTQNDKDSLLYEMAWTSGVFRSQSWNIDGHYQAVAPEIQAARDAAAQQLAAEQASATEAPPIEGEGDISPPQG